MTTPQEALHGTLLALFKQDDMRCLLTYGICLMYSRGMEHCVVVWCAHNVGRFDRLPLASGRVDASVPAAPDRGWARGRGQGMSW
eukprot:CAMPEP_0119356340 /NCGR_PEP_ID=MMETSP1334-20130426/4973_1 /TAXON_ID=127549 /ORGANISM="Calcidiscus leptoporus, Strain RCC1130" /LENGTH=84 /DNA_ID=CAMNT_0007370357 /DNA_START=131 /DNA_END=382 /DNA_ORIENTATION=+